MSFDIASLTLILPELFMASAGLLLVVFGAFLGNKSLASISWVSFWVFLAAIFMVLAADWSPVTIMNDMLILDGFGAGFKIMVLAGMMASVLLSLNFVMTQDGLGRFEYPILMLLAGLGMLIMIMSNNLLTVYMGLELQSLSLYVLAALQTKSIKSSEAGIKYFVLGALASGMFLFGTSFVYGYTGSIEFQAIGSSVTALASGEAQALPAGFILGMVFVLIAIVFKISAAPFHMWTPDVYQGAPTSVTAFFALVPKVAAIALLIRLLHVPFAAAVDEWQQIIWFVSAASMIVGAFAALVQDNVKRLLAYSSIGHMGYALIGIVLATSYGLEAVVAYLVIYMFMTAGTFAVILMMRKEDVPVTSIRDLAGLSSYQPAMAYALAILMFSMAGIPPLAGFFGKLYIFKAAIEADFVILAVLGVLTSVVAAYYYLRIIKVMFFDEVANEEIVFVKSKSLRVLTWGSLVFVVGFILMPSPVLDFAQSVISGLLG